MPASSMEAGQKIRPCEIPLSVANPTISAAAESTAVNRPSPLIQRRRVDPPSALEAGAPASAVKAGLESAMRLRLVAGLALWPGTQSSIVQSLGDFGLSLPWSRKT